MKKLISPFQYANFYLYALSNQDPVWRKEIVDGAIDHRACYMLTRYDVGMAPRARRGLELFEKAAKRADPSFEKHCENDNYFFDFRTKLPFHALSQALRELHATIEISFKKTERGYEYRPSNKIEHVFHMNPLSFIKTLIPREAEATYYFKLPGDFPSHMVGNGGILAFSGDVVTEDVFNAYSDYMAQHGMPVSDREKCFDHAEIGQKAFKAVSSKLKIQSPFLDCAN